METTAHFDKIAACIGNHLRNAKEDVVIAVAWFTDPDLFDILCRVAGQGRRVRLAVLKDKINVGCGRLNFTRLKEMGGEVFLIPCKGGVGPPIMHHKFCVIDGATIIIGSYNWTRRARANDESVIVLSNAVELASEYLNVFGALLQKYNFDMSSVGAVGISDCLKRIKRLVGLQDWAALAVELDKLGPVEKDERLSSFRCMLERRDRDAAGVWIDELLKRYSALAVTAEQDLSVLRLMLRGLEHCLTSLSSEKAELERLVNIFVLRSSCELGEFITEYLNLRAELMRRKYEADPDDGVSQAEAESARAEYEDYREANEGGKSQKVPIELGPGDTEALKRLYREASQKCHPDKVSVEDRACASEWFVQLNSAYKANDISGVRAIHAAVREGNIFIDRVEVLTEAEMLGHAIVQIRQEIRELTVQINQLRHSDAYLVFYELTDWDAYFSEQRESLVQSIGKLQEELSKNGKDWGL